MELVVTERPHMILETVELLYAWTNGLSPEQLTYPGMYCLPIKAVQNIMEVVCRDISRDQSALKYYFGKRVFYEEPEQTTCVARHLCYNNAAISTGSVQEDFRRLRECWRFKARRNWRLVMLDRFNLAFSGSEDEQYVPIADDLAQLGVSQEYSSVLLEQMAGYESALDRLEKIIVPIAEKLESLLEPWVERAKPLAQAWMDYYGIPEGENRLYQRISFKQDERVQKLYVQLRYLRPKDGPGNTWNSNDVYLHMGVAIPVENVSRDDFEPWEYQALRLLGSESRMQMIRAMVNHPMSSRELARDLNMHLGVVTRDVSSLQDARLLTLEISNRHRRYRTNIQTIEMLIHHLSKLKSGDMQ